MLMAMMLRPLLRGEVFGESRIDRRAENVLNVSVRRVLPCATLAQIKF